MQLLRALSVALLVASASAWQPLKMGMSPGTVKVRLNESYRKSRGPNSSLGASLGAPKKYMYAQGLTYRRDNMPIYQTQQLKAC
jgi:hypothetical protein